MLTVNAQTAVKPGEILGKTANIITTSKGVETDFKVYNSGYSGSGKIKVSGNKFTVMLPDVEVWYNGKDLYTYNKNTAETTVVNPTAEELRESNPLAYVVSAQKNYTITFSTVKKAGKYVLELTPKAKGEIKRITLTVDKNTYYPEKIVVEPAKGSPITADITGFRIMKSVNLSEFEYPHSKYPKVEIVDLR